MTSEAQPPSTPSDVAPSGSDTPAEQASETRSERPKPSAEGDRSSDAARAPESAPTGAGRKESKLKAFAKKLGTALLSVLLSMLVLDIVLHIAGKHYESSLHTPDPDIGWTFRPGARGWSTLEGRQYIEINSDGFRDIEHPIEKPAGTLRIFLLGDSFAANYNVALEDTFWKVFEVELAKCPALGGRKVEIINSGVGGYGQAHEYLMLQKKGWKYNPDWVLLAFFVGNDILNNHPALNPNNARQSPYFVYKDGALVLDDAFKKSIPGPTALAARNLVADLTNHSEVFLLLKVAAAAAERARLHPAGSMPKDLGAPYSYVYAAPKTPEMEEAWRVTEGLLKKIRDEVTARGKGFSVTTIPDPTQAYPDEGERAAFLKAVGADGLFYVEERLTTFAQKEQVPMFHLGPQMVDHAMKNKVFLYGFANANPWGGHWNEKGHHLGGEMMARHYCQRVTEGAFTLPP